MMGFNYHLNIIINLDLLLDGSVLIRFSNIIEDFKFKHFLLLLANKVA